MQNLTDEFIRKERASWIKELGENFSFEELTYVNEKLRAMFVLQTTHGNMRPPAAMSLYMVRDDVAKEILEKYVGIDTEFETKAKRSDKYSAIQAWCKENVLAQVSTKEIADIGEISYQTALKYISDHPDMFWKISRGVYEVRDPVEDRKNDKKKAS
jgi:hypothetical protein